jgi:hypothetical protein
MADEVGQIVRATLLDTDMRLRSARSERVALSAARGDKSKADSDSNCPRPLGAALIGWFAFAEMFGRADAFSLGQPSAAAFVRHSAQA